MLAIFFASQSPPTQPQSNMTIETARFSSISRKA